MDFQGWLTPLLRSMLNDSRNVEWMDENARKELEDCYRGEGAEPAERLLMQMVRAGQVQGF